MCCGRFSYAGVDALKDQGFSTIIPQKQFLSDVTYSDFSFYKCVNEKKFYDKLAQVRVDNFSTLKDKVKNQDDVRKLSYYSDSGLDLRKWGTSIKNLLGSIVLDQSEIDNAQCKIAFAKDKNK